MHSPPRSLDNHRKTALLLLVCLLFAAAFAYLLTRQPMILIRSDHFSRWYATYKLAYEHRSIYDPQNGREVVALNTLPVNPVEGSFFYPAPLLVFTLPLAWLPYPTAHFIWVTVIQLFMVVGIYLVARQLDWPHSINHLSLFLLLTIIFIPNLQHTIWGQFNTISVIGLALTYLCLYRGQYFWAGLWLFSLTFKPHNMLLSLAFLLLWALFKKERWPLWLGFGLGGLCMWAFAEWLEPGWVESFLKGVRAYSAFHKLIPVLDQFGLPAGVLPAILLGATALVFLRNRGAGPRSPAFDGCLVLSLAVWWLVVPILGMMHMVSLPLALVLLFANLEKTQPRLSRWGVIGFLILYALGLVGFVYGLSSPGLYGLHIRLAEAAYKIGMPILTIALSIPLCFSEEQGHFVVSPIEA